MATYALRIISVWIIALSAWGLEVYGGESFGMVFMIYAFFWTIPALVALLVVSAAELGLFAATRSRLLALLAGPCATLLAVWTVEGIAYRDRSALVGLCITVGVLWLISGVLVAVWQTRRARPA